MEMSQYSPIHSAMAAGQRVSKATDSIETPDTVDEAADQFGKVLLRQLVQELTDDLFSGIEGKHQSGALRNQARLQSETLTEVLTEKLEKSLHVGDQLRQRWNRQTSTQSGSVTDPAQVQE